MSDDFIALLRSGIPVPPAQQLISFLQAQHQLNQMNQLNQQQHQQLNQQQQQQNILNALQFLDSHQLLQNIGDQAAFHQSPQRVQQTIIPQDDKTPKKIKNELPQLSASLPALKLNLDGHQMHRQTHTHNDQPPLSSTTSIDEGVMTSSNSPTETASGTASPLHEDDHELPKEPEHTRLKRPAAIQDMLLKNKKKARLDGLMEGLFNKKVSAKTEFKLPKII